VTGIDAEGRSCVLQEIDFQPSTTGFANAQLYYSESAPPARPAGKGRFNDVKVPPGATRWVVVSYPPNLVIDDHHTDTVDFQTCIAGEVVLVLDDGRHPMTVGDCAMLPGNDHGWEAGPEGCVLSLTLLGSPPPA
jgi:hypothetical protein